MRPARSTATTRSSSACRPTSRSAAPSSRPAACAWSRPASRPPASRPIRRCTRPSRNTARRTTTASSTPIRRRSCAAAESGIITGLPDAYGRGRIIGDYRRVALYGIDRLLAAKREERAQIDDMWPTDDVIRTREELAEQMRALADLAEMGRRYGCDIARPAETAREAVQWTYLAYLGAIKEANGAAMSIGRISTFLDIYIERDLREGTLDEAGAQELIDQLVQKLRIVRFLRTPDYDALFSGDPYWATECIGGMDLDGRTLVTRTSYRMLHTLTNLGPAPEPNMTVLWSKNLPDAVQALLHQGQPRHLVAAVRERRPDAALLGRRLRHRLLRLGDAAGQADAVLRRAGEPRQGAALRHQRRPRRGQRRAGRAALAAGDRRRARLRRGFREVRRHDGVARAHLRARDELHPLHARQVLLRAPRDGAARPRHPAHHGLRHRRPVGRGRQPLGDQARQGARDPRRDRASPSTTGSRATSRNSAMPIRGWTTSPPISCRASWPSSASTRPIATRCTPSRC